MARMAKHSDKTFCLLSQKMYPVHIRDSMVSLQFRSLWISFGFLFGFPQGFFQNLEGAPPPCPHVVSPQRWVNSKATPGETAKWGAPLSGSMRICRGITLRAMALNGHPTQLMTRGQVAVMDGKSKRDHEPWFKLIVPLKDGRGRIGDQTQYLKLPKWMLAAKSR